MCIQNTCENYEYFGSVIDESVITCNKFIEATKNVLVIFNKKATCKVGNDHVLATFI